MYAPRTRTPKFVKETSLQLKSITYWSSYSDILPVAVDKLSIKAKQRTNEAIQHYKPNNPNR